MLSENKIALDHEIHEEEQSFSGEFGWNGAKFHLDVEELNQDIRH